MIKKKCDRCGSPLGTESKKTKERFCGKCKNCGKLLEDSLLTYCSSKCQFEEYCERPLR